MTTAKKSLTSRLLLLAGALILTACRPAPSPEATKAAPEPAAPPADASSTEAPAEATKNRHFRVTGSIRKLKNEGRIAVIDHDEIPGYMERMVMPFHARDTTVFAAVKPGDRVIFDYYVTDSDAWVENVTVTGSGPAPAPDDPAVETPILRAGDTMPDRVFLDQDGRERRLSEFRGKTVALTFIFTRCPAPDFCPKMMRHFAETAQRLAGGPDDWHLLTVSFDPENDTPAVLKAFGQAYGQDPARWTMLVGDAATTTAIARDVGLRYGRTAPEAPYQHNLRTVVLRPDGTVAKLFLDEDWTPDDLAAAIRAK